MKKFFDLPRYFNNWFAITLVTAPVCGILFASKIPALDNPTGFSLAFILIYSLVTALVLLPTLFNGKVILKSLALKALSALKGKKEVKEVEAQELV